MTPLEQKLFERIVEAQERTAEATERMADYLSTIAQAVDRIKDNENNQK